MDYFPDERDQLRLPRQFIVNVLHTVVREPIRLMVKEAIKNRNDLVAENRNLIIELDPEIAAAFKESINISSKLGMQQ